MINFEDVIKENIKEHNTNWLQIPDHPYRILITEDSGSGETNSLFSLIRQLEDIDKIYWYAKDRYEIKYQFSINKRESTGLKYLNDSKAFNKYSNDLDDFHKNIEEYNLHLKSKILNFSDNMIADMISNRKLNSIVTELFIRDRKLNISLDSVT